MRVPVELSEVKVNERGVQVSCKTLCKRPRKPAAMSVIIVDVVLEADVFRSDTFRVVHSGDHPAILFLGRKSLHEHIRSPRDE